MSLSANELWNAWRNSAQIRGLAEGLITRPEGRWSSDDEALYAILHSEPDSALSAIFAAMQLTDDERVLGAPPPSLCAHRLWKVSVSTIQKEEAQITNPPTANGVAA